MALDPALAELARSKNFAALSTLMPDGQPQTQLMWLDADDDHLLINTDVGRQKFRNVERDPRVTVTVFDRDDPYRYVEARGRVVSTDSGPSARAHIDQLAQKYTGADYSKPIEGGRVVLRIAVDRVHRNGI